MLDQDLVDRICLDIGKGNSKEFSDISSKILKSFATISTTFFEFKRFDKLRTNFTKELVSSIITLVEMYDHYTKGHSENVAKLSLLIAEKMNLSAKTIRSVYWAGLVHDIGKLLISV